jgi:hypothetical protein
MQSTVPCVDGRLPHLTHCPAAFLSVYRSRFFSLLYSYIRSRFSPLYLWLLAEAFSAQSGQSVRPGTADALLQRTQNPFFFDQM